LATGANHCQVISDDKQFNMPAAFVNGSNWPASRGANSDHIPIWNHSDMDQVAYPFLFKLYNQLSIIANQ
jgi:hypothetical protein